MKRWVIGRASTFKNAGIGGAAGGAVAHLGRRPRLVKVHI